MARKSSVCWDGCWKLIPVFSLVTDSPPSTVHRTSLLRLATGAVNWILLGMGFPRKLILLRTRSRFDESCHQWTVRYDHDKDLLKQPYRLSRLYRVILPVRKERGLHFMHTAPTLDAFGSNVLRLKPVSEGLAEMHEHFQTTGHIHKTWHVRRSFRSNPLALWKICERHAWVCYHQVICWDFDQIYYAGWLWPRALRISQKVRERRMAMSMSQPNVGCIYNVPCLLCILMYYKTRVWMDLIFDSLGQTDKQMMLAHIHRSYSQNESLPKF